jgi:hypothetical protein
MFSSRKRVRFTFLFPYEKYLTQKKPQKHQKQDEFQVPGSKRPRKNEFDFRKNKKPRTSMIKVITTAKKPDAKKPKPKFTFLSSKQRLKVEKNQRRADRVVQKENVSFFSKSFPIFLVFAIGEKIAQIS